MTLGDLAKQLASDYAGQGIAETKVASIHLFGIRWADQLHGVRLTELCAEAGIPVSLATELAKGRTLAKYVEIRG